MLASHVHYHQEFGLPHAADLFEKGWTICVLPGVRENAYIGFRGLDQLADLEVAEQSKWIGAFSHKDQPDVGLRPRGKTMDKKWIYHHRDLFEAELLVNGVDVNVWRRFLDANTANRARCKQLEAQVWAAIGQGIVGDPYSDYDFLRLLRYDPADTLNEVIGVGHFDRSALAFLFAGTHPGVRIAEHDLYASAPPPLELVELDEDQVLIGIGAKLTAATRGRLRAQWHDVIATTLGVHRYVQVFFTHCAISDEVFSSDYHSHNYDWVARLVREYHQDQHREIAARAV